MRQPSGQGDISEAGLCRNARENSVKVVEVLGKDISRECSICGVIGEKQRAVSLSELRISDRRKRRIRREMQKRGMGV